MLSEEPKEKDYYETDIEKLWLSEIKQYPVLTEEEEKKYGEDLALKEDLTVLDDKGNIDLISIFQNISDASIAEIVISSLKKMYHTIADDSLKKEREELIKYQRLFQKLKRPLTEEEINDYFSKREKKQNLSSEELLEQVKKYIQFNMARYKMFHSNLRLIIKIAKDYSRKSGLEFIDLASEGSIGLKAAIDNFDISLGYRFSTYAIPCIKQTISNYVSQHSNSLKLQRNHWKNIKKLRQKVAEMEEETKEHYTAKELAILLDMEYEEVLGLLTYQGKTTSLDQPIGEDEETTFLEMIEGDEVDFEQNLSNRELEEILESILGELTENEEKIIRKLYGMNEEQRIYTTEEIAKELKMTKERVRMIVSKALRKIRIHIQKNHKEKELQKYLN